MKSLTEHLWFEVPKRRGFVNITHTVEELVRKSGVQEGLCLVNAMHITHRGMPTEHRRAWDSPQSHPAQNARIISPLLPIPCRPSIERQRFRPTELLRPIAKIMADP